MAYIKINQPIDTETTLEELREFVMLTKNMPGDTKVAEYEENGDLVGIEIFLNVADLNIKE